MEKCELLSSYAVWILAAIFRDWSMITYGMETTGLKHSIKKLLKGSPGKKRKNFTHNAPAVQKISKRSLTSHSKCGIRAKPVTRARVTRPSNIRNAVRRFRCVNMKLNDSSVCWRICKQVLTLSSDRRCVNIADNFTFSFCLLAFH